MQPQNQQKNSELGELHPNEVMLIQLIRESYPNGEITIVTHKGIPRDILTTVDEVRVLSSEELLNLIQKKFRFGEITIVTRDGVPQAARRTTKRERINLSTS